MQSSFEVYVPYSSSGHVVPLYKNYSTVENNRNIFVPL